MTELLEKFQTQRVEKLYSLDSIGGMKGLKKWISIRKWAFTEESRKFVPVPKGIILCGIPGTGKTLVAKVCAAEFDIPLYRLNYWNVFRREGQEIPIDQAEKDFIETLKAIEAIGPCVLWIDTIEKWFISLATANRGEGYRTLGVFLTWIYERPSPTFVVATCNNRVNEVPRAFFARLDETFFIDVPNEEERQEILKICLNKRGQNPEEFDLKALAQASGGFTGADLEEVMISSLFKAYECKEKLGSECILDTIKKTNPRVQQIPGDLDVLRKWAEMYALNAAI